MLRIVTINKIHLILQTLLVLSISACATQAQKPLESKVSRKNKGNHSAQDIYPESLSLSQHILLTVKGKEFDFPAYLAVDRNKGYRAVAFTDMGGKVFDFLSINGKSKIISKPERMPDVPILRGVMNDISLLFMPYGVDSQPLYREDRNSPDDVDIKTNFSDDDRISSYEIKKKGEPFSKITLSNYRLFTGWNKALPARIEIINYRWDYTIEIELLKINMATLNKKVLSMELLNND